MSKKLELSDVKWLHVELTTKCNAWCPSCGRNQNGFGLSKDLIIQDLKLKRLAEVLELIPNCKTIQLCGNFGDPIAAGNILNVLNFLIKKNYDIRIHTNGGLKTTKWWTSVGNLLSNIKHEVIFGIDGSTQEIHQIHRQGTNLSKVISNAQSFIAAGGIAVWQFIPYEHNKHQIVECLRLSKAMKFKRFEILKKPRNIPNALHYKTGERLEFKEWVDNPYISKLEASNCMHLDMASLFLSATGNLTPCCYMRSVKFDDEIDIASELQSNPRKTCQIKCGF